ncbi:long-chain fatty acid transport protein 4 [Stomoxys calcitrans]|uniref:long-chain fatty acid transport protein 4 n=1 Tax=Stomoxys calcitrans TaxID=35570 RepID=UPI0027E3087D|nr:long-chain fatty acid transport protein 4 [Stomoxys calcitrans]XP_013118527.2 long-chain fatty acid transport protein 4 [Stomoxys calcitrans]XP_059226542.1 long-chain fatty acid transport protein 4 [Stomoxys calcitrans]
MNLLLELNFKQKNATRFFTVLGGFLTFLLIKDNAKLSLLLGAILALMLKNPTFVYAFYNTMGRDTITGYRCAKMTIFLYLMERKRWSMARIFQENCKRHPEKACFLIDNRQMTFQDVEDYSNKVGSYFKSKGLRRGDCVAVLLEGRPEYVCLWLGLSKIGVISALINTNQKSEPLLHSLKVANSKAIIVGTELTNALSEIRNHEDIKSLPVYQFSDEEQRTNANLDLMKDAIDLTEELKNQRPENLAADISQCDHKDKLMYIYTSGTTGLPKAAVITNQRYLFMTTASTHVIAIKENDIIYNPLPLYHTAGGVVCIGMALVHGCTIALRRKFSVSNFWKDCIKFNATAAQHIGELCRYLLSAPARPEDTQHKLRLMYGNGLRAQIWSQFATRFNIPFIAELYGSTEGNANLANVSNQVGAIGFIPILLRNIIHLQVIRVDEETGEPIRNAKGFCIRCNPGETGLFIGKIDPSKAITNFSGYADKGASEKKLLHNVFKKGDVYFNSGDMLVGDLLNFYYFKDRTGDTFRWRGENVSTQEVEGIITNVIGLQDCVVYGVEIPHIEGKAGMAAIEDPEHKTDFQHLSVGIRASLPPYARPLFVRVMKEIPRTTTFKMKKRDLMLDGFDMHKITDPLYYLNSDGIYRPLTSEQYDALQNGTAGL